MDLIYEKIVYLIVLFILGYGSGSLPYLLKNRCLSPSSFRTAFVSFMNCFSAGVFFSTFFMHMLPEAQVEFSLVFGEDVAYPFAELLVSLGFFFVMIVEQSVMTWYGRKKDDKAADGSSSTTKRKDTDNNPVLVNDKAKYRSFDETSDSKSTTVFRRNESTSTTVTEVTCCDSEPSVYQQASGGIEMNGVTLSRHNSISSRTECAVEDEEHSHFDASPHSTVRALVLLFALSTHALFEGLTIGFQSSAQSLRSLVVAVIIHKMALAFSYGISLVNNQAKLKVVLMSMLIFSIMAPIGIGIGTGLFYIKSANDTVEMVVAVMQAFAAGTFVYVIFIEIIPHEFSSTTSDNKLFKAFYLLVGFATMAALQALPSE